MRCRVIPVLLLKQAGLYKGIRFKDHKYIGDPINAIRIFNEKEVDELMFLDIEATNSGKTPNLEMLRDIASECFMPLSYGGAINSIESIKAILSVGIEKVVLNTGIIENLNFLKEAVKYFGTSTIVASIDVKKSTFGGYNVYSHSGKIKTNLKPVNWAKTLEMAGVGEIVINSIDRDGTLCGYDYELLGSVIKVVSVPIIISGGSSGMPDFKKAFLEGGASGVAGGACFVFQGKHRAVLITYPDKSDLAELVK